MTVVTTSNKTFALGNGVDTAIPYSFRIFKNTDIVVIQTNISTGVDTTPLVLNTDYTVTGAANYNGGFVNMVVPPPTGIRTTVARILELKQQTDLRNQGAYFAETHEDVFDHEIMIDQQQQEAIDRSIRLPITAPTNVSVMLPLPSPNQLIGWDASGTALDNIDITDLVNIATYGSWLHQSFSGNGVQTDFVLSSDPVSIDNCDITVGGVPQRSVIDANIVAVNTIRILPAPPSGTNNVFFRWGTALPLGVATAIAGQTTIGTSLIQAASAASARAVLGVDSAPVNVASASNVNLTAVLGETVNLTGVVAVNSWTLTAGKRYRVQFTAATPITYNAVTNRVQGGSSITGEVGSYLVIYFDGTTTYVDYVLGSGAAASGPSYTTVPTTITATGATLTNNAVGVPTKVNSATATTTTLMAVSTLIIGQSFTLANIGVGVATFNCVGSDTITGCNLTTATSISLNKGESATLTCDSASTLLITASNVGFFGRQMVQLNTTNGNGSVNTVIRRWFNATTNVGTDITYADSATLGGSFTINTPGVYSINYTDQFNISGGGQITLNSTIYPAIGASLLGALSTPGANFVQGASWTGYLPAGSVIRSAVSSASGTSTTQCVFTIARVS